MPAERYASRLTGTPRRHAWPARVISVTFGVSMAASPQTVRRDVF
jgi:hypothetical protein